MKSSLSAVLVMSGFITSGCSIQQNIRPVESNVKIKEICVIRNDKVRVDFLNACVDALKSKGFQTRVLNDGASLIQCPVSSTYSANWAWDLAMYMRYAELKIYRNAALFGEAIYDATWGGARLDKFISAEKKVRELVDQIFPQESAPEQ